MSSQVLYCHSLTYGVSLNTSLLMVSRSAYSLVHRASILNLYRTASTFINRHRHPPAAAPARPKIMAKVLYDYAGGKDYELPIKKDEIIEIVQKENNGESTFPGRLPNLSIRWHDFTNQQQGGGLVKAILDRLGSLLRTSRNRPVLRCHLRSRPSRRRQLHQSGRPRAASRLICSLAIRA